MEIISFECDLATVCYTKRYRINMTFFRCIKALYLSKIVDMALLICSFEPHKEFGCAIVMGENCMNCIFSYFLRFIFYCAFFCILDGVYIKLINNVEGYAKAIEYVVAFCRM